MSQGNTKILETMQGEIIVLTTKSRTEDEYSGAELLEINHLGATIKYSDHGRDFMDFIPMTNIDSISFKILGN